MSEQDGGEPTVGAAPRVLVAVLTYRRPEDLRDALPLLTAQTAQLPRASVLVVDNDPEAGAGALVDQVASSAVRYVHEPRPGIAAARNRALDEATALGFDLLVFVDDDERPVEGWLPLLLATWQRSRPAAVVGPVVSQYAVEPDEWLRAGRFFDRLRHPTGTQVQVAATNNLLLDLAQVRAAGLRFDERFGTSGGSDQMFTRALVAHGGRMVWCDEALVVDVVPPQRLTRTWVLRRAARSGNTWARTSLHLADGRGARAVARVRVGGQGAARVLGGAARAAVGVVTRDLAHRARGRRTIARGTGMLAGAAGLVLAEYDRSGRTVHRDRHLDGT